MSDFRYPERAEKFMQGFDTEGMRQREAMQEVELRRSKRTDAAIKRRNMTMDREWVKVNEHFKPRYTLVDLPDLLAAMTTQEDQQLLFSAQGFRKLLSLEHEPPIQTVIDAGVVGYLVSWIQRGDFPQLQYEAAWTITNITSGTHQHCQAVTEKGCVPVLISLLHSPNEDVKEQVVWALGNIGGDSAHSRDLVLQNGGLPLLIKCVLETSKPSLLKNGTWAVSNLCRGKPLPDYNEVKQAVPILGKIVQEHHDAEMLSDTLWALCHLSEGAEERVNAFIETGALPRVISLLNHHAYNVQLPAIRCVGNVVTGSEIQTQTAVNLGAVQGLTMLLGSAKRNVRKEAVWAISNVCAGNHDQLGTVINSDAFPKLILIAQHDDKEIKKEAVWALSNACAGGRPDQVAQLVNQGVIQGLCALTTQQEVKIVSIALEGLNRTLRCGKEHFTENGVNPFCNIVEDTSGLTQLEALQSHPNMQIYIKARNIIEEYFEVEEDENQELLDTIIQCSQFSF